MNNELKSLKLRAGVEFNPDQEGLDLFAELIIRDCINIARAGLAPAVVAVIKERYELND